MKTRIFDGRKDNNENKRPETGIFCHAFTPGNKNIISKNSYMLINILTNYGMHDTYILKNAETGKIRKATMIIVFYPYDIMPLDDLTKKAIIKKYASE